MIPKSLPVALRSLKDAASGTTLGAVAALIVFAAGCATITGGSNQSMYVQIQNTPGVPATAADCELSNDKGRWLVHAPNDTTIVRSNKPMLVKCTGAGVQPGTVSVESATRAAMFGNILLGGAIGAVIDHNSGAGYEYPGIVTVVFGQTSSLKMEYAANPQGANGGPTAVPRVIPQGSGYAALADVERVPAGAAGQDQYRRFLAAKLPRAFVVANDGTTQFANGLHGKDLTKPTDPAQRALQYCTDRGHPGCQLYAVDNQVVYVKPDAASMAAAAIAAPPVQKPNLFVLPAPSNFARLEDASAVPVKAAGQGRYLHYLTLPKPRAFVVYEDGDWYMSWNSGSAMANALNACERAGKTCWLYAADDEVVWQPDVNKRISKASQLVSASAAR